MANRLADQAGDGEYEACKSIPGSGDLDAWGEAHRDDGCRHHACELMASALLDGLSIEEVSRCE